MQLECLHLAIQSFRPPPDGNRGARSLRNGANGANGDKGVTQRDVLDPNKQFEKSLCWNEEIWQSLRQ